MLLLLTLAAGSVDAISYLGLEHVFTAMMTGNTVLLGLALGQGEILAASRNILALLGFGGGVILGATIAERDRSQSDWPPAVTKALTLEWVLLGAFAALWHLTGPARGEVVLYSLIVLTAVAMGVQSAAVRRLGVPGIATTYITGTLTGLMVDIAHLSRPVVGAATRDRAPVQWERRVGLLAAVFVVYAVGAFTGSFLRLRSFGFATLVPFLAVSVVVGSAAIRQRRLA
jgi:uncharacterized membrane protein YoaK (UPF0700 family)